MDRNDPMSWGDSGPGGMPIINWQSRVNVV
jgi:hypothetical protein